MLRLIITRLITLNISILPSPIQAQEVENRDCTATIAAAQNQIETGRSVGVTVRSTKISETYSDYPTERPYNNVFLLEGAAAESIMNSPNFMKSIATKMINNCSSVGSVTFAVNYTGWSYSIGLIEGRLDFFECLEHDGSNRELTWGQEYCSL